MKYKSKKAYKCKILNNKQRLEAAKLGVNSGLSIASVARTYDVSEQAISRVVKKKRELEDGINDKTINPNKKRNKKGTFSDIEKKLITWIEVARVFDLPVTRPVIQAQALKIANESSHNEENKYGQFQASKGWFRGFISRYGLKMYKLVGELSSSKIEINAHAFAEISEKISQYHPDNFFNMDEAALFYKMLPRFSYCLPFEVAVRGTKIEKERVTIILCCNMTGSKKLDPTIIGKSVSPKCFKKNNPPIEYKFSKKSWINRELFTTWFHETFVKYIRTFTNEQVLLIVDNCSSHLKLSYENITVQFLPPNVTSTSQPLDQGIVSIVKRRYRTLLLESFLSNIELYQKMAKRKRKLSGLSIGGLPDLMDAAMMLKKSWDDISSLTITKCWLRANITSPTTNAQIRNEVISEEQLKLVDDEITKIDQLSDSLAELVSTPEENQPNQTEKKEN